MMILTNLYILLALLLIPIGYAVYKSPAPFLMLGIPAVYALCCAVNLGDGWMGNRAKPAHLVVGAIYLLFWALFTFAARRSYGMLRLCQIIALLGLGGAATGLLVRTVSWELLVIPALLLTPFSSIPLYGLRMFLDWTGMELVSGGLSLLWLCVSSYLLWKQKQTCKSSPPGLK